MKRTEFNKFSSAYGQDSAMWWCFDWIHYKYGTDMMAVALRGTEEWKRYFEQILPQKLEEFINAFDFGVLKRDDSPLWDEISDNVSGMDVEASELQGYIFSLLMPFKRYSKEFYLGGMASVMQDVYRNPKYNGESVVQCYRSLVEAVQRFGVRLDALLLGFGINIQWYQREKGIYISPERMRLERVSQYFGCKELAKRYISEALPKAYDGQPQHEINGMNGAKEIPQESQPHPKQQQKSQPARGKGRPKETLKDKMVNDVDGSRLAKVHTVMNGKKNKDAALIILACIKKGWMLKPTFTQVEEEFGDIGVQQGFTKYLNGNQFTKDEIEGAINSLD